MHMSIHVAFVNKNHLQQIHNKLLKRHLILSILKIHRVFLLKRSNVRRHLMDFNLVSFKTKKTIESIKKTLQ